MLKSNCGGTSPALDETLTAGMGNSQSFTRQTAVEYVNDDDFTTVYCGTDDSGTDSIRITVTVTPNMMQGSLSGERLRGQWSALCAMRHALCVVSAA